MTKECLAAIPGTSISGQRVARELDRIAGMRGLPCMVVSDNGTEFTSLAVPTFTREPKLDRRCIAPGKPMQNCFVDSFQGRMRDACLK